MTIKSWLVCLLLCGLVGCEDKVSKADLDNAKKEVDATKKEVAELKVQLEKAQEPKETKEEKILRLQTELATRDLKYEQEKSATKTAEVERLKEEIKEAKEKLGKEPDLQVRIKSFEAEKKVMEDKIQRLEEEIRRLKESRGEIPKKPNELNFAEGLARLQQLNYERNRLLIELRDWRFNVRTANSIVDREVSNIYRRLREIAEEENRIKNGY